MDVFCDLVDRIDSPHFGVNYDPSNTILAGEDPLELLRRVKHRVVTMHASDRYLSRGHDRRPAHARKTRVGYAKRLRHGEIGKGMNDYDAIFSELARASGSTAGSASRTAWTASTNSAQASALPAQKNGPVLVA